MADGLQLHDVALLEFGETISLSLKLGESLCIVGPGGSGKSRLLRVVGGLEKPTRGAVTTSSSPAPEPLPKRTRVQDIGRRQGQVSANDHTETISQLGLWEVRQMFVEEINREQAAAAELVEQFLSDRAIICLDGKLDALDPWARHGALNLCKRAHNRSLVVTTNNLDLVSQFDHVVVLKDYQAVYAGHVHVLLEREAVRTITIQSHFQPGLRALVEPFSASVERVEGGIKIAPKRGQECAAKLLREGYGDLNFVITDRRSISQIILGLL